MPPQHRIKQLSINCLHYDYFGHVLSELTPEYRIFLQQYNCWSVCCILFQLDIFRSSTAPFLSSNIFYHNCFNGLFVTTICSTSKQCHTREVNKMFFYYFIKIFAAELEIHQCTLKRVNLFIRNSEIIHTFYMPF